jgi:Carboxypeptidase regulatory-like domain
MTRIAPTKPSARIIRLLCRIPGLIATIMLTATLAVAQYRASIQGVVTDPEGAVIAGASLTLTDLSTNFKWTAASNAQGIFDFEALPADTFRLEVSAANFASTTLNNVTIIPEQPNTINIKLAIGNTTQNVTVNAGTVPALDTTTANISGTITSNQIQHMPSFNRDVFELASLAPGMFGDNSQSSSGNENNLPAEQNGGIQASQGIFTKGELTPQVVGDGGQNNSSLYVIDGIPTASASWAGSTVIVPQEDSVQYVKVTANDYDAEFGRFSGAVIQVTSNTGTNAYHGSLFFKGDRPGLNAYQRWNGPNSVGPADAGLPPTSRNLAKDTQRYNQFGGSAGGPILHNRIFAFFAYETLRNDSATTGSGLFETPYIDGAAPAGSIASKYLTLKGDPPAATGVIPGTCTSTLGLPEATSNGNGTYTGYCHTSAPGEFNIGSPLTTPLGTHDPTWVSSNKPGVGDGLNGTADLEEVATVNPSTFVGTQYNGRMDGDLTSKDRLSFIIYWAPNETTSYNGPARPSNFEYAGDINNAFTGLWNHTFSPTLLNEARASASGYRYNLIAQNPQGTFGLPTDTFTGVSPSAEPSQFGESIPGVFDQWTYTYQDIVTKNLGRHSLKAGFQLSYVEFLDEPVSNAHPSFTFESFWDFLNDAPVTESGTFNALTGVPELVRNDDRQEIAGIFAQDDYKITPSLTVNLGLRWNYLGSMTDKQNNLSVLDFGTGSSMLTGLKIVQQHALATVQPANFGPQLGFAWDPNFYTNKVVFRGGFGINYEENQIAILRSGDANVPAAISFSASAFSPSIVYNTAPNIDSPFGYPANTHAITTFNSNNIPNTAVVSVDAFDNNQKTMTVYHYSLDTEIELPDNFVGTLGYQGSSGHHLFYEVDMNAVAAVRGYPLNPQLNRITDFTNGANSNYNAMLASLKHNFSHSFQIETDYTWSRSMDEGSTSYNEDAYAPISIRDVYGASDYNFKNNVRIFGLYEPNFFHEHWLHSFADGWSLGGTYEYHSGFPWTPTYPVTSNGLVGGPSGHLYYENSPYTSIRPAAYNGGRLNTSTAAFESGPSSSYPTNHNVNFPTGTGGESYFAPAVYTAAPNSAAFTTEYPAPPPVMERNSFTGPMFQSVNVSLAKNFHLPEARVIGDNAGIEFRADAYNLFNLTSLSAPTTGITSTNFGQSQGALAGRIVEMQARFSF